jgi:hypothetical protein
MARKPVFRAAAKPVARAATQLVPVNTPVAARLKSFGKGDADHPGFSFTRYWWEGEGPREGVEPWMHKKIRPGDHPEFGFAAKGEILLPHTAPGEYGNMLYALERFDETMPFERHAMIQVKLSLDEEEPWHAGYERVRGFARSHFANRFAVILVAHIPGVAGLNGNGSHIHCIVLSRFLTINGFGGACYSLCSDTGYEEALTAWQEWTAREGAA